MPISLSYIFGSIFPFLFLCFFHIKESIGKFVPGRHINYCTVLPLNEAGSLIMLQTPAFQVQVLWGETGGLSRVFPFLALVLFCCLLLSKCTITAPCSTSSRIASVVPADKAYFRILIFRKKIQSLYQYLSCYVWALGESADSRKSTICSTYKHKLI